MRNIRTTRIIIEIIVISLLLIIPIFNKSGLPLMFIAFGTPDSHANDHRNVAVFQDNGTAFNLVYNFTTSNQTVSINDGKAINLEDVIKYNVTLAVDNATARSYTRVNITISYNSGTSFIVNNSPMTQYGTSYNDTQFYYITFYYNWSSSLAVQGVTYNCSFAYQPYY